jgi:hypothetical protein
MPHSLPDRRPAHIQPAAQFFPGKKSGGVFSEEFENLIIHHRHLLVKITFGLGKVNLVDPNIIFPLDACLRENPPCGTKAGGRIVD